MQDIDIWKTNHCLNSAITEDVEEQLRQTPAAAVTPREQQELKEELKTSHREAVAASANAAFATKVHKRKRNNEVSFSYAVHEKATKKQVVQLTTSVKENADEIVDSVVKKLNAGERTKEEAIAEVNAFKGVSV